jgi:hypothetical protein
MLPVYPGLYPLFCRHRMTKFSLDGLMALAQRARIKLGTAIEEV